MKNLFLLYITIINLIGFLFMYIDKHRAINNKWRIKESTLISICIIGGSMGSLIGMYAFRHKTKHPKFTLGVPTIILIQLILLNYLNM